MTRLACGPVVCAGESRTKLRRVPWLYGTILSRGTTTILVAPGGVGKSQLALAMAADLGSGRGLLGFHIFQRVAVWYFNLEDDEDELDRRVAAFRLVHNVAWDELKIGSSRIRAASVLSV